ncbi:MAG: MoaD/ThiS family protein [Chloroflexi bacterium]|nr:MoaD/ThiS family protein [Chloroflexota bacterium]MBU1747676.1 MoaD/ThiS family protein [Chloroflexota bacterium]
MKVQLKILLPVLPETIGRKELEVEFAGESVGDLLDYLVARYGRPARQALYDKKGEWDPMVQILLNGKEWVPHDQLDTALHDGDSVLLMVMMGGG